MLGKYSEVNLRPFDTSSSLVMSDSTTDQYGSSSLNSSFLTSSIYYKSRIKRKNLRRQRRHFRKHGTAIYTRQTTAEISDAVAKYQKRSKRKIIKPSRKEHKYNNSKHEESENDVKKYYEKQNQYFLNIINNKNTIANRNTIFPISTPAPTNAPLSPRRKTNQNVFSDKWSDPQSTREKGSGQGIESDNEESSSLSALRSSASTSSISSLYSITNDDDERCSATGGSDDQSTSITDVELDISSTSTLTCVSDSSYAFYYDEDSEYEQYQEENEDKANIKYRTNRDHITICCLLI
ncbi:hypothetical protein TRFO_07546 [Tritrichomonas foetus]|uniref:Uncharacterized protein n=1 Tax=Tritrichomonas foetus TaxID=1144522 RepID=A0A1J4JRH1_9EUKA|nr:hypothetical protein TRFO_07546 [Tritrichomonas foetus]|eukprot:OHT01627.1 hypothetical protein TRFO_07546 [Tritrichomonas foetus]